MNALERMSKENESRRRQEQLIVNALVEARALNLTKDADVALMIRLALKHEYVR